MLGGAGSGGRHVANGWPQSPCPIRRWTSLGGWMALLWQRWLGVRKGDGHGGVVEVGGRVKLWGVSGGAVPLVGIQSGTVLHGRVVMVRGSVLLDVVRVMRVRPTQHQPPTQRGESGNWDVGDRGTFHAAGCRLGGWWFMSVGWFRGVWVRFSGWRWSVDLGWGWFSRAIGWGLALSGGQSSSLWRVKGLQMEKDGLGVCVLCRWSMNRGWRSLTVCLVWCGRCHRVKGRSWRHIWTTVLLVGSHRGWVYLCCAVVVGVCLCGCVWVWLCVFGRWRLCATFLAFQGFLNDVISSVASDLGLRSLVVTADDVCGPDLILPPSWTGALTERHGD